MLYNGMNQKFVLLMLLKFTKKIDDRVILPLDGVSSPTALSVVYMLWNDYTYYISFNETVYMIN